MRQVLLRPSKKQKRCQIYFLNRSFRLNFEITAMITDYDFKAAVEKIFLEDLGNLQIM